MGNCFAKNKLPGCFKLREDQGTVFFIKGILFFHTTKLGCSDTPELAWGPPGPGAGLALLLLPGVEAGEASWAVDIHTLTPRTLAAHHQGVFISMERGLREAVVAVAPNLGAPGWASCWWGWGAGGSRNSTTSTFFSPSFVCFPLLKGKSWFLKHSVGDILVKMQYFYVM